MLSWKRFYLSILPIIFYLYRYRTLANANYVKISSEDAHDRSPKPKNINDCFVVQGNGEIVGAGIARPAGIYTNSHWTSVNTYNVPHGRPMVATTKVNDI